MPPPVVVHPPDHEGARRVQCDGEDLGRAFNIYDVMDLLNRAGLSRAATAFDDTTIFDWRGGGPYHWEPGPDAARDT
ncbi:hypothetical protein [Streptomyces sp. HNM0574]|uniref:hypothetical protein n=1 Tax=Streptomyces sp. HNM0574 TaxID=2714954 RepID=UPI001469CD79|nr:hypothetical protein [Streptomyces sp. HNM0574]NLU70553.1 hypothetical protein [Streptomyces sp. HNM0574]